MIDKRARRQAEKALSEARNALSRVQTLELAFRALITAKNSLDEAVAASAGPTVGVAE